MSGPLAFLGTGNAVEGVRDMRVVDAIFISTRNNGARTLVAGD